MFRLEVPSCGSFGPKIQNFLLKVKLGIKKNSNMQNSMEVFTFPFFTKFTLSGHI